MTSIITIEIIKDYVFDAFYLIRILSKIKFKPLLKSKQIYFSSQEIPDLNVQALEACPDNPNRVRIHRGLSRERSD